MSKLSELALAHLAQNPPAPGSIEEVVLQLAREVAALESSARYASMAGMQSNFQGGQAYAQNAYWQQQGYSSEQASAYAQQQRASWSNFRDNPQAAKPRAAHSSTWKAALGITTENPSKADINAAYRQKAKTAHPDQGGSTEAMAALNAARAQALRETA